MFLTITKIISKFAFSKPATRLYPFVKRQPYKNTRGQIKIDVNTCTFCTLCQKKCPTFAIVVNRAEKVWTIDRLKCIQCAACVDACPKDCLTMGNQYAAAMTQKSIEVFRPEAKVDATV
jgi:formate hydrogenlyase subunit 6/NADH:ubiquinone oxidoreductase subunit I